MKFDEYGALVREKYEPWDHPGNTGDSMADTSRYYILRWEDDDSDKLLAPFVTPKGYVRHPRSPWREDDVSSDQLLPFLLAGYCTGQGATHEVFCNENKWTIRGTRTLVSPGIFCFTRGWYWLLNISNIVQGLLLALPYRWSDSKAWFERTDGSVADYLNMVCIYVFLKRIGRWATLPRPADECLAAVRRYYLEGDDREPNSEWICELYERSLR